MNSEKIRLAIEEASIDAGLDYERARETAFHMTDWLGDLEPWHQFCENPEGLKSSELQSLLVSFLNHVPDHIAAARKLYLGFPIEDIFKVGIFDEEDDSTEA